MKAILALLLGLISQSWADSDSVVLDFESPDSDEISTGGDQADEATSFGGLIIQVRQGTDESPTIALGSDIDDYDDVYCLNFLGLFEASSYDTNTTTSAAFTRIDDSFSDLADANCTSSQQDTGSDAAILFSIRCTNVGDSDAVLTLTFSFIQDEAGDYGLEYIINLAGYELSDGAANLVLVQSLNECGDTIDLESAEDEGASTTEEPDSEPDETESAEDTTTDEPENGRRLLQFSSTDSAEPTDDPEPTQVDDPEGTDSMEPTDTESAEVSGTESGEEDSTDDASADDESTDTSTDESTDEESLEEEDGISEDDSGEFDTGFARFVVNGQALDVCGEDQREIGSTLVYQPDEGDDGELHIVFDSFNCTLVLDPFYGLDDSKYQVRYGSNDASSTDKPDDIVTTEDNAHRFGIMIAMVIGLFAYLW